MTLDLIVATIGQPDWQRCVNSWKDLAASDSHEMELIAGLPIMKAYQEGFIASKADIQSYIHDDCEVLEQAWDYRVIREFDDPKVGMVGLGGALRHGSPSLYIEPYKLQQLGRFGFMSNMVNAEDHGLRFTGECDVAVVDGFAMFVRRSIIEAMGGWPQHTPIGYFNYDYLLSCEVRRQGYRIRLVGIACNHLSGRSASMVNLSDDHAKAHEWLAEEYCDVLPYEVPQ